jgi:hypothetical protein
MACDEDALPLRSRIDAAADETELEDIYDTERQLLYVAATRARDRLLITGVKPGSEFLKDMGFRCRGDRAESSFCACSGSWADVSRLDRYRRATTNQSKCSQRMRGIQDGDLLRRARIQEVY